MTTRPSGRQRFEAATRSAFALIVLTAAQPGAAADFASPLSPPSPAVLDEARAIVAAMEVNPRGPYERLRWFCNDGTVLPPNTYACREHGGGHQHGEYSNARKRLAELGWHVGTIVTALSLEELWDEPHAQGRLRELPLEAYLIDTQDGWVMRRARYYRGHVQAEDEDAAGRALLLELLGRQAWIGSNYLLLRETARALPHGAGGDRGREMRRLAQAIAEREASFERLRAEVHGEPSAATAAKVRAWMADYETRDNPNPEVLADAGRVATLLTESFEVTGRGARLRETAERLARRPGLADIADQVAGLEALDSAARFSSLASLTLAIRGQILGGAPATDRLRLLDLLADLELEARVTATERLEAGPLTRAQHLQLAGELVDIAHATGYLSVGERGALADQLALASAQELDLASYQQLLESLTLAMGWATGTVRHAFAEALVRYTALDPVSARFVDDTLRGSVMLSLADSLQPLFNDVQTLSGVRRSIGDTPAPGLVALNAGYARGRLVVVADDEDVNASRGDIVLLSQTTAELPPVAGVLTRGAGNLLSHVQLLARNFGIPNVAVGEREAAELAALSGTVIELIAGSDGSVLIRPSVDFTAESGVGAVENTELTAPVPDLEARHPLPLSALSRTLSGRVVGPKAANLGELNRLFPGRVAPAVALPFGVFADYVGRGPDSPLNRLAKVYENKTQLSADELATALTEIREAIATVTLSDALLDELLPMLEAQFGPPDSYGVFVRSDTNVEDLPGFTGAGLNETVPNVRGLDNQLATIPRVWASVLSPRAVAWRSELLTNPADVYASVLLMKSVPADKSGVLVTANLAGRGTGLTVSTAWGVGGAVAGEAAETVTLRDDGGERLISEAKAPFRRFLPDEGGILWHRAASGPVLTNADKATLRTLADEVAQKYAPVRDADGRTLPWDIEFGFVDGELTLFQIRPLIERGRRRADRALVAAIGPPHPAATVVSLDEIVPRPDTRVTDDEEPRQP